VAAIEKVLGLFLCTPLHVTHLWRWIEGGVQTLQRKCEDDYSDKDLYWYLRENKASLLLVFVDGEYRGFVVLEIATDPFKGRKRLCVWMLYFLGANEYREVLMERLKNMKTALNCRELEFRSPLKGWDREARKLGFRLCMQTWRAD
jgi:hypothetical protein